MKQIKLTLKDIAEYFSQIEKRHFYNPALKPLLGTMQLDFCILVAKKRKLNPRDIYEQLINDITEISKKGLDNANA